MSVAELSRRNRELAERLERAQLPELQFNRSKAKECYGPAWTEKRRIAAEIIDGGGMVAILGVPGTGKTQMAVDLALHVLRLGRTARYVPAQNVFSDLRECYGQGATTREKEVIERYVRPHFLILDDIHVRGHTDAENRALFAIIDARYNRMRPSFMAANVDAETFKAQVGAAIFDRIVEMGGIVVCSWPSYRLAKAIERKGGAQ